MNKYIMKDNNDYRMGVDESRAHGVVLVRKDEDGIEYAFGEFKNIDNDMLELSEGDIHLLGDLIKVIVPAKITKRQARQQLVIDGLYNKVQLIIDAIEDPTEKLLTQVFWEDSNEFERDHSMLIQFATALGLDSEALDQMFIKASRL